MMSYIVAKILKIRPLEIMKTWSCEELLVTFGVYMNQLANERYSDYKSMSAEQRKGVKEPPPEYTVKFLTFEQLNNLANPKPKTEQEKLNDMKTEMMIEAFMKGGGNIG